MRRGIALLLTLFLAFMAKGQNVGVGIAAPNDLFHVYGITASMGILFNNVTTGSAADDGLSITIDGSKNVLFRQQESADMQFLTGGAVRMRIDRSGFISINSSPGTGAQFLVSTSTVNYAGLVGVGNGGSGSLPGSTGFGVLGSVGVGNPNVGVGGFYGGNVDIGSGGAGVFGSSKGTSGTSYGVYGTATGTASNIAGYFTASGGTNNYAVIIPGGGGSVGIGTNAPDASSILDMSGVTTKGMMIPKVALTAVNAAGPISSPATSLLVYNTATAGISPNNVTPGYYYNAGTPGSPNWEQLLVSGAAISAGWLTSGNSSTTPGTFVAPGTNFLGTIDNFDFTIRTNNIERMRFANTGTIGINIAPAANYQLDVTNSAPSGKGLAGIYGTYLASGAGTGGAGVIGIGNGASYPSTFAGSVGVLGAVGSAATSAGVAGYAGPAGWSSAVVSAVYGESTLNTTNAIYGINSAPAGPGTTSNKGNGVFGSTRQSQSSGVYGTNNFGGPGVSGISLSNSSSIYGDGVYGESDGNGVVGICKAAGAGGVNFSGVYGQYQPPSLNGPGGIAAVLGWNDNQAATSGNVGVEGYYYFGGVQPYGIGVLGSGLGGITTTTTLNGDFGVLGNIAGTRVGSAAVAGFIGTPVTFATADAAIYGSSSKAAQWALYGTNTNGSTGDGLFVSGFSNLNGQVAVNQAAVPNSNLKMATNGNTYSDNQITAVCLWAGGSNAGVGYVVNQGTSGDLVNIESGFEPSLYRTDGYIQIKITVYYTSTAGNNDFSLNAYKSGTSVAPVIPISGTTYVTNSGNNNTVFTSPWSDWIAGTTAWDIHLNAHIYGGGGNCTIKNVILYIRPKNN